MWFSDYLKSIIFCRIAGGMFVHIPHSFIINSFLAKPPPLLLRGAAAPSSSSSKRKGPGPWRSSRTGRTSWPRRRQWNAEHVREEPVSKAAPHWSDFGSRAMGARQTGRRTWGAQRQARTVLHTTAFWVSNQDGRFPGRRRGVFERSFGHWWGGGSFLVCMSEAFACKSPPPQRMWRNASLLDLFDVPHCQ